MCYYMCVGSFWLKGPEMACGACVGALTLVALLVALICYSFFSPE